MGQTIHVTFEKQYIQNKKQRPPDLNAEILIAFGGSVVANAKSEQPKRQVKRIVERLGARKKTFWRRLLYSHL
ncbi:MAG: hypothetical protein U5L04_00240 [Trueperaceae bacterium]|nr:hypothetical protein [Trueperaceae bacterium]